MHSNRIIDADDFFTDKTAFLSRMYSLYHTYPLLSIGGWAEGSLSALWIIVRKNKKFFQNPLTNEGGRIIIITVSAG